MAELAKQGVAAGMVKLHQTETGVLAQVIRGCNVLTGSALVLGSGVLTLWECVVELWLCNEFNSDNRCVQGLACAGDAMTLEDFAACASADSSYVRCQAACGLGALDVLSTVVIAMFMFPLGGMLLAFELTRSSTGGLIRAMLEEYFGFMLQYRGRMKALLFYGTLALGNVTQNLDGDDEIYHWGGLLAGVAAVLAAVLHAAVIKTHPEYDREMTVQQERMAAMRRHPVATAGGSSGVGERPRSDAGRGAFSPARNVVGKLAGRGDVRAAAPPADDAGERAAAALEAARALGQSSSSRKAPPPALPIARNRMHSPSATGASLHGMKPLPPSLDTLTRGARTTTPQRAAAGVNSPPALAQAGASLHGMKRQPPSLKTVAMATRATTPPRVQRKQQPPPLSSMRP